MSQKSIYFDEMENMVRTICHMAEKLNNVFSGSSTITNAGEKMKNDTVSISMIKSNMIKKLDHDFLPPIDREDIVLLMQSAEDTAFSIKEIAASVYATGTAMDKKSAADLSAGTYECSRLLYIASASLKTGAGKASLSVFDDIKKCLARIFDEHDTAMKKLFSERGDALLTAKWIKIFDSLHRAAQQCKKNADTIEYAILKNS